MNPLFEEKTKLFPLHEISFCICQILKGVSFAFSFQKKVPFIACKDFGQDAQNARVANWLRQCIESAIGKNAGKGGNVAIGLGANWARHYQYNTIKCNIIKYYRDNLGAAASGYLTLDVQFGTLARERPQL